MESDLRLGPFQIIILLLLFLASCDSQQTSEEESDLEGLGTAGVEITPPFSSNTTTESGGTVSFKIRLTSAPLSDVTINLKSDNESEGKVNPQTLTFNKDNWNVYVSITVTGQDDSPNDVADGTQNYSIVVDSIISNDAKYGALSVNPVQLKNLDNEIADFKVDPSPSWSGNTSENGTITSSFTVKLKSKPLNNVSIPVSVSDTSEANVSTDNLTFTSDNYSLEQTVTITGISDNATRDGDVSYKIEIGRSISIEGDPYHQRPKQFLDLISLDNESSIITVDPAIIDNLTESKTTGENFIVTMETPPSADVTLKLRSTDPGEGIINPSSLSFPKTETYPLKRTVTVKSADDTLKDGIQTFYIELEKITGSESGYNNYDPPARVTVTNKDNEGVVGIIITEKDPSTSEEGQKGSFSVRLRVPPFLS